MIKNLAKEQCTKVGGGIDGNVTAPITFATSAAKWIADLDITQWAQFMGGAILSVCGYFGFRAIGGCYRTRHRKTAATTHRVSSSATSTPARSSSRFSVAGTPFVGGATQSSIVATSK